MERTQFKETTWQKYVCPVCTGLLKQPQQLSSCGHWGCLDCIKSVIENERPPLCPVDDCSDEITAENGEPPYFPDRAVKREIDSFEVLCFYNGDGCDWEGKYGSLAEHMKQCKFSCIECELCKQAVAADQAEEHRTLCPKANVLCPYHDIGCSNGSPMARSSLETHCIEFQMEHALQVVKSVKNTEKLSDNVLQKVDELTKQLHLMTIRQQSLESGHFEKVDSDGARRDVFSEAKTSVQLSLRDEIGSVESLSQRYARKDMELDLKLMQPHLDKMKEDLLAALRVDLNEKTSADSRRKDEEITALKEKMLQQEKMIRAKTAEAEDRDFRLSLLENSNYEGNLVWKIPQFSQRKADAESGKYTSIFSLPFYTGRYGYKMCLRLYILGDGVGKNTHMSLFFVIMRGEFDNILQWPFTHKVTFKLMNQRGSRDVIDTFQPDPISSSFRKPKSDMNVASGCPRFVSHQELQNGGFIEDDTIFIKCIIDKNTIRHP